MVNRDKLRAALIEHEGNRPRVYDDANGHDIVAGYTVIGNPTIGVGRNLMTKGLSRSETYYLLDNDILECIIDCQKFNWWNVQNEVRQRALVELRFELGLGGLLGFKQTLASWAAGDYKAAADGLRASKWHREVSNSRSGAIISMVETGVEI